MLLMAVDMVRIVFIKILTVLKRRVVDNKESFHTCF